MTKNYFDEDVAARYDDSRGPEFDPEAIGRTVDVLAELAGDGAALEFAVGTGRIALPLAARGVPVSGIELSAAMAERLRAKDEAGRVQVTLGDMATTRVDGRFRLVYNPTAGGRRKLDVAVSTDGTSWHPLVTLENSRGEYSYPAMVQTRDGKVHVTYTWKRQRVKHVVIDVAAAN